MTEEINNEIRYNLGRNAISSYGQRYITKEELKNKVDYETFKKFEPIFDYFDKYDNYSYENDGILDLATFASFTQFELLNEKEGKHTAPTGYYTLFDIHDDSGINEKRVNKLCTEIHSCRSNIIDFIKNIFSMQANGDDTYIKDDALINKQFKDGNPVYTRGEKQNISIEVLYDTKGYISTIKRNNNEIYTNKNKSKSFNLDKLIKKFRNDENTTFLLNILIN